MPFFGTKREASLADNLKLMHLCRLHKILRQIYTHPLLLQKVTMSPLGGWRFVFKRKIYMEAPLSAGGWGERETLNSSLYKLLSRRPIGHPWMDNESVKGSAYTSPPTSNFSSSHYFAVQCMWKWPLAANNKHHPSVSPCCWARAPSARSLLDLARLDLVFTTSDLCVNIAFVSASNLAIRSAFARSRPAYLQEGIF